MNRKEMIDVLAGSVPDLSKADANRVYDGLAELAKKCLSTDGEFLLPGLGALKVRLQKARTARNPKTGAPVHVPEKKTVRFSAYKELKELLNPALAVQPAAPEPAQPVAPPPSFAAPAAPQAPAQEETQDAQAPAPETAAPQL